MFLRQDSALSNDSYWDFDCLPTFSISPATSTSGWPDPQQRKVALGTSGSLSTSLGPLPCKDNLDDVSSLPGRTGRQLHILWSSWAIEKQHHLFRLVSIGHKHWSWLMIQGGSCHSPALWYQSDHKHRQWELSKGCHNRFFQLCRSDWGITHCLRNGQKALLWALLVGPSNWCNTGLDCSWCSTHCYSFTILPCSFGANIWLGVSFTPFGFTLG